MKKSLFLMAIAGVCALALAACGKEDDFSAGKKLSADEAGDYREKLLEETAEQPEEREEGPVSGFPAVCYYTEKGGKWHVDADCRYLKNSQEVLEGSVESANFAGKDQPCSACAAAYAKP